MADIYSRIGLVMRDLPAIGKEQKNTQHGWMFRGIDMIMNYVEPLFVKHGVFMVPQVLDSIREERQTKNGGNMIYTKLRIKYTFYSTSDGSYIEAVVDGEGMDTGDKSTNKAMAVAMKYALFQVLCIPTEEMAIPERMVDPDQETPEESVPKSKPQPAKSMKLLLTAAVDAYGKEAAPKKFDQLLMAAGCTRETMTEAKYDTIYGWIMDDLNEKKGA